jgi:hypothetical protein
VSVDAAIDANASESAAEASADTTAEAAADTGLETASDANVDAPLDTPEAAAPPGAGITSASCGAIPVLGPQTPEVTDACSTCASANCCSEAKACAAEVPCLSYRDCVANCTDSACQQACLKAAPDTKTSDAFAICRSSKCNVECGATSCVGATTTWPATLATSRTLTWTLSDYQAGTPIAGLTVKLCPRTDPLCAAPTKTQTSDAKGQVTFTAPATADGWDSYLDVTGTGVKSTLIYLWWTNVEGYYGATTTTAFNAAILSTGIFASYESVLGVTDDPSRGAVTFNVAECRGNRLANATVACDLADDKSLTSYLDGASGIPSKTSTATDFSGTGAITNVKPGTATLTATWKTTGKTIGTYSLPIRAGYVTSTVLSPPPSK